MINGFAVFGVREEAEVASLEAFLQSWLRHRKNAVASDAVAAMGAVADAYPDLFAVDVAAAYIRHCNVLASAPTRAAGGGFAVDVAVIFLQFLAWSLVKAATTAASVEPSL